MRRFFTIQQAEQLLSDLESAIRDAIQLKSEYQQAEGELQNFARRVMLLGGVVVDHTQIQNQKSRKDSIAGRLKGVLEGIQESGCLVKDLDTGLVDFPTHFKGEEVYLCWKLGEPKIGFWHGVEEGFRGRKPIDEEFLEQHRGELPN